jgi:hypothetical protein
MGRFPVARRRNFAVRDHHFTLARGTVPARVHDDRLHRGLDDLGFAERASEDVIVEFEFDGPHDGIG